MPRWPARCMPLPRLARPRRRKVETTRERRRHSNRQDLLALGQRHDEFPGWTPLRGEVVHDELPHPGTDPLG